MQVSAAAPPPAQAPVLVRPCGVPPWQHPLLAGRAPACSAAFRFLALLSSPTRQMALGVMVNFFFSGFILGKVPFALSPKFRVMLQASGGKGGGVG